MSIKEENDRARIIMHKNLKYLRELRNWSIEDLSKIFGIHKKILTDIEEGGDFELDYLFTLCGIYHIKPSELFAIINN